MALLFSSLSYTPLPPISNSNSFTFHKDRNHFSLPFSSRLQCSITASNLCTPTPTTTTTVDTSSLILAEAFSEDQLWAASCLRVRSFYDFNPTVYAIHVSPDSFFYLFISQIIRNKIDFWDMGFLYFCVGKLDDPKKSQL